MPSCVHGNGLRKSIIQVNTTEITKDTESTRKQYLNASSAGSDRLSTIV